MFEWQRNTAAASEDAKTCTSGIKSYFLCLQLSVRCFSLPANTLGMVLVVLSRQSASLQAMESETVLLCQTRAINCNTCLKKESSSCSNDNIDLRASHKSHYTLTIENEYNCRSRDKKFGTLVKAHNGLLPRREAAWQRTTGENKSVYILFTPPVSWTLAVVFRYERTT